MAEIKREIIKVDICSGPIYIIDNNHTLSDIARFFLDQCGDYAEALYILENIKKETNLAGQVEEYNTEEV